MMITHKIKTINIKNFRGITDSKLNLDGKSLIIKGDNGTGKSSIVDAFEFFFTGEISRLKGTRGISLKKHAPHVNYNANDIQIEVIFNNGTSVFKDFKNNLHPPHQLEDYFNTTVGKKFILHRAEILEFITTTPSERFKSIANIIGIKELDDKELILKKARDKVKGEYQFYTKDIDSIFQDLSKLLENKITEEHQILKSINTFLSKKNFPEIESLDKISSSIENRYKSIIVKRQESKKLAVVKEVLEAINRFRIKTDIAIQAQEISKFAINKAEMIQKNTSNITDFLKLGKDILIDDELQTCPFCEQTIDTNLLIQQVTKRMDEIYESTKIASSIRQKVSEIEFALSEMTSNLGNIIYKIKEVPQLTIFEEPLSEIQDFLEMYSKVLFDDKKQKENIESTFKKKLESLEKIIREIREKSKRLKYEIDLTREDHETLECIEVMQNVRIKHEDLLKNRKKVEQKEKEFSRADQIYSKFLDIKRTKIQELYNNLQALIHKFYIKIHPNESYENLRLKIKPNARASTNLIMDCLGQTKEDPRAYSSEGHLDTLGLCIFLAFHKRFNQDCPLLILDDVVSTVDNGHRNRIAELILTEFSDIQCIITTCDGIWYKQLLAHQRVLKLESKFKNINIIDWALDSGPVMKKVKLDWDLLMDNINQGDITAAGGKARTYFEYLLKEFCERMKVPIPYKNDPRYTVAELFNPAQSRVKKLLKKVPDTNKLKSAIFRSFENLKSNQFMFNLLAHDNIEAHEFNLEEVKSFCNMILKFSEAISCPECKRFLKYEQGPREIRCVNPKCQKQLLVRLENN